MATVLSFADVIQAGPYTLYRSLVEAGIDADHASVITDLLYPEPRYSEPEPEPVLPPISGGAPESEPDWDEYARWSAWQDALEAAHPPVRDEDLVHAGLPVG